MTTARRLALGIQLAAACDQLQVGTDELERRVQTQLHPMHCAWCREQGVTRVIGWTSCEGSDGICREHYVEMVGEEPPAWEGT